MTDGLNIIDLARQQHRLYLPGSERDRPHRPLGATSPTRPSADPTTGRLWSRRRLHELYEYVVDSSPRRRSTRRSKSVTAPHVVDRRHRRRRVTGVAIEPLLAHRLLRVRRGGDMGAAETSAPPPRPCRRTSTRDSCRPPRLDLGQHLRPARHRRDHRDGRRSPGRFPGELRVQLGGARRSAAASVAADHGQSVVTQQPARRGGRQRRGHLPRRDDGAVATLRRRWWRGRGPGGCRAAAPGTGRCTSRRRARPPRACRRRRPRRRARRPRGRGR